MALNMFKRAASFISGVSISAWANFKVFLAKETSPTAACSCASHVGRPLSAADEIRVVGEDDHDVERGAAGELLVRGPYTLRGYYRAEVRPRDRAIP